MSERQITGRHVAAGFVGAFAIIIGVNVTMAWQAVRTFPGVEVRNSFVASQTFDADRSAQEALGWTVEAGVEGGEFHLAFLSDDGRARPDILRATFGRATHVKADQELAFRWTGTGYVAPVETAPGNWNLRLEAVAEDGTVFRQRIPVDVRG